VHTKWANRYEPGQPSTWSLISTVLFDSNVGPKDLRDYVTGLTNSQDHFRDAVEHEDLPSLGTTFPIPFFVFQGTVDKVTPVAPVREYVNGITAPQKELVLIPNAGHNAIATKSDEFLKLLLEKVRPLVLNRQTSIINLKSHAQNDELLEGAAGAMLVSLRRTATRTLF
jgi:hypothetical protein